MTDHIDPSKIRPARGLLAAVSKIGLIHPATTLDSEEADTRYLLAMLFDHAVRGWRIIRIDVVPHEGGSDA